MKIDPQIMIGEKQLVIVRRFTEGEDNLMLYPYVMVQPSQYLHPTYICSWINCKRYIALQHYLKQKFQINLNLVYGNACHKFFQYLIDNLQTIEGKQFASFQAVLKTIYRQLLYEFYIILQQTLQKVDFERFFKDCRNSLQNIHNWVVRHVIEKRVITDGDYPHLEIQITDVIGSQTMHTSKYFGLKGKTDGLFQGMRHNKLKKTKDVVFVPFELKTGYKVYDTHKKQLDIYNMLLREKENKPTVGVLFYSARDLMFVRPERAELAFLNIVIHRNTILLDMNKLYSEDKIHFPDFTFAGSPCRYCNKCVQCQAFHIFNKLQQSGSNYYKQQYSSQERKNSPPKQNVENAQQIDEEKKLMLQMFDEMSEEEIHQKLKTPSDQNEKARQKLSTLSYPEMRYLQTWLRCLHFEERETRIAKEKTQKEKINLFALSPSQLSKIKDFFEADHQDEDRLTLSISKAFHSIDQLNNLRDSFKVSQKVRVTIGFLGLTEYCKIVSVKKQGTIFSLDIIFNSQDITYYKGYLLKGIKQNITCDVEIERYDNQQFSALRNSVFQFMTGKNEPLKRLVIENYKSNSSTQTDQSSEDLIRPQQQLNNQISPVQIYPQDYKSFNKYQQSAFRKTFSGDYCTLVEGMPGTGKTELIVKILQKCAKLGWRVLVTTFTNRSLDNILQRTLKGEKVSKQQIIREGSKDSIDPKLIRYHSSSQQFTDIQEYKGYFDEKKFWFVTLSSINSPHIPKNFDLVILDEASQSLQPACIEALCRGRKIVLIGDYKQLQPIVRSRKAISSRMNVSLFEKLCLSRGNDLVSLCYQYRMNKDIMRLSNTLVYDGSLELQKEKWGQRKVRLSADWRRVCGIQQVIDIVNPERPLVFLNHDWMLHYINHKEQEQIRHLLEIELAIFLFKKFVQLGVGLADIAVVCVYNKTVDTIKNYLEKQSLLQDDLEIDKNEKEESQVLTIDKSQGIDKEVIILLAESRQSTNNVILEDSRRFNVTLTRAKTKLIIIGSLTYLQQENSVFDGRLPRLLRQSNEIQVQKQLVDHVLSHFDINAS